MLVVSVLVEVGVVMVVVEEVNGQVKLGEDGVGSDSGGMLVVDVDKLTRRHITLHHTATIKSSVCREIYSPPIFSN